jgi:cell wall-associated NlpC family hydrolase
VITAGKPPRGPMLSREEAVAVARAWEGTPYLIAIGASEREELGVYSHDWFCHTTEERYMFALMKHAKKTLETVAAGSTLAQPGDLVLFRVAKSRVFNHGGIVTAWPRMIHAVMPRVAEASATLHPMTSHMQMAIFSPWGVL